jgi:hypothetical protein
MNVEKQTRKADKKARIALFPDFAGHLVIVERVGADELRVVKARVVRRRRSLDELLAGITDEQLHGEIDFGPPVGKEAL